MPDRPTLRLWHNLARSGSTLIGRCLGSMRSVCLLSEIHPLGARFLNPFKQAHGWFKLFSPEDIRRLNAGPIPYPELMILMDRRATERGRQLVIRSWEHLDFYGPPFLAKPPMRPLNLEVLSPAANLLRVATVRHPIDQWISLGTLKVMQGHLSLEQHLSGYRKFVETCLPEMVIRYEDFTKNPDGELRRMCQAIGVEFDPTYTERWPDYTTITGDIHNSRGLGAREIKPMPRREVKPSLLAQFDASEDYHVVLKALGYGHPE